MLTGPLSIVKASEPTICLLNYEHVVVVFCYLHIPFKKIKQESGGENELLCKYIDNNRLLTNFLCQ